MMKKLLVATTNKGKYLEIQAALKDCVEELFSLADLQGAPSVEETGSTFCENAMIKAQSLARFSGLPTLADDSGLVVDILNGRPGVYSARYGGEQASDADNIRKLLADLCAIGATNPSAAFVCSMALCFPEGGHQLFEGRIAGEIISELRGSGGFGYDPCFLVKEFGRTMSELTLEEKNRISHRGQALSQLKDYLRL